MNCPPCNGSCNQGRQCPGARDVGADGLFWGRPGRGPMEPALYGAVAGAAHGGPSLLRLLIARWLHPDAASQPSAKK